MFINPGVDLALIAGGIVFASQMLQLVLINRKEFRATQKEMKAKQKEHREIMQKGGTSKEEMERLQREQVELMQKSMKHMPKMLIGSFLVILPLFYFATSSYGEAEIPLFFPLNLVWETTSWIYWYMLCSLLISLIVNRVVSAYEDRHEKKMAQASV